MFGQDEEEEPGTPTSLLRSGVRHPSVHDRSPGMMTAWGPLDLDSTLPSVAEGEEGEERLSLASVMSDAADGEWLFSQLVRMVPHAEVRCRRRGEQPSSTPVLLL